MVSKATYLIRNAVKWQYCEILLCFKILYYNIFQNVVYSCNGNGEFSAAVTPVSSKGSLRNQSFVSF